MEKELVSIITGKDMREARIYSTSLFEVIFAEEIVSTVETGYSRSQYGNGAVFDGTNNESSDNFKKGRCIVHSLTIPENRNSVVEEQKIREYLFAKYILENKLEEQLRTVYVPEVRKHGIDEEFTNKPIGEIYVDYEPRHLVFEIADKIKPEDYAYCLGRDVARFLYMGMVNVDRHIRPNFTEKGFRTCMIDLDTLDPGTFKWIVSDFHDVKANNYKSDIDKEQSFYKSVSEYFLNALFPNDFSQEERLKWSVKLKNIYKKGFIQEIGNLRGKDIAKQFHVVQLINNIQLTLLKKYNL